MEFLRASVVHCENVAFIPASHSRTLSARCPEGPVGAGVPRQMKQEVDWGQNPISKCLQRGAGANPEFPSGLVSRRTGHFSSGLQAPGQQGALANSRVSVYPRSHSTTRAGGVSGLSPLASDAHCVLSICCAPQSRSEGWGLQVGSLSRFHPVQLPDPKHIYFCPALFSSPLWPQMGADSPASGKTGSAEPQKKGCGGCSPSPLYGMGCLVCDRAAQLPGPMQL